MIEPSILAKVLYEVERADKWDSAKLDVREAFIRRANEVVAQYDRIFYGA